MAERKRAEAELRPGEERYRAILESITNAFYAFDRDWRFTHVNRRAEALLGRGREGLIGKVAWEVYPDAVGSDFDIAYHRAMEEKVVVTFEASYPPRQRRRGAAPVSLLKPDQERHQVHVRRGTIALRTRNEWEAVVIEVADTGIGIDPDILPRIFDAFHQGDARITRKFGGLGLGLAICRGVADRPRHGRGHPPQPRGGVHHAQDQAHRLRQARGHDPPGRLLKPAAPEDSRQFLGRPRDVALIRPRRLLIRARDVLGFPEAILADNHRSRAWPDPGNSR